jgi:hypothetical protein
MKLERVGVQNLYICMLVSSTPPRLSASRVGISVCPPERHETSAHPCMSRARVLSESPHASQQPATQCTGASEQQRVPVLRRAYEVVNHHP